MMNLSPSLSLIHSHFDNSKPRTLHAVHMSTMCILEIEAKQTLIKYENWALGILFDSNSQASHIRYISNQRLSHNAQYTFSAEIFTIFRLALDKYLY